MACPDEMTLARFAVRALPLHQALSVSRHCLHCRDCRRLTCALAAVERRALGSGRRARPPPL